MSDKINKSIKFILLTIICVKFLATILMFLFGGMLFPLHSFSIFTTPYILASFYVVDKALFLPLLLLIIVVNVGWISNILALIFSKRKIVVSIVTFLLATTDIVCLSLSYSQTATASKVIGIIFNGIIIVLSLSYLLTSRGVLNEKNRV